VSRTIVGLNSFNPLNADVRPSPVGDARGEYAVTRTAPSASRVSARMPVFSTFGVLLRGGRSPNRTSLVRLIRRGCTPTPFPASLRLHRRLFDGKPRHRQLIEHG
jgi:hypothetical protein